MNVTELKTGMVVKIRNGDKFLVLKDTIGFRFGLKNETLLVHELKTVIPQYDYTFDLYSKVDKVYDIVEVKRLDIVVDMFQPFDYDELELLWERSPTVEYVVANHFGKTKNYIWECGIDDIYAGDIIKVETSKGDKIVKVKRLFQTKADLQHKKVISKVVI